jgi:hypothetical protein
LQLQEAVTVIKQLQSENEKVEAVLAQDRHDRLQVVAAERQRTREAEGLRARNLYDWREAVSKRAIEAEEALGASEALAEQLRVQLKLAGNALTDEKALSTKTRESVVKLASDVEGEIVNNNEMSKTGGVGDEGSGDVADAGGSA